MGQWWWLFPDREPEPMGAYRCSTCSYNFKTGGKCRACGEALSYMSNAHPTPEDQLPPEVKKTLPELTEAEQRKVDEDWAWVASRSAASGGLLSVADVVAGFPRHFDPGTNV